MEVIYLDILIMINLTVDFLLLTITARLAGRHVSMGRILCGASIGALFAVISILRLPFISNAIIRLATALFMVYVTFGKKISIFRIYFLFIAISCALAGFTTALWFITGSNIGTVGSYYFEVPIKIVICACILSYVCISWLFSGVAKHGIVNQTTQSVLISAFDKTEKFELLLDSGCDLYDPISGKAIIILERQAVYKLLPSTLKFLCVDIQTQNISDIFLKIPSEHRNLFRLVPFNAVGTQGGMLLIFSLQDAKTIDGEKLDVYVAISPQKISNGRYEGLIGI